ncbi:SpoIIE family protein phosphatase [Streptomyces tendae]|uniref:SpoIIE family protein phosphatase n=1 Tax=Streptomyces tendae TaxID=1932 RepID=UPI0037956878
MGAIPTQRETASRASAAPAHAVEASVAGSEGSEGCARARVSLLGSSLAPGAARAMARAALADWSALGLPGAEQLTEHLAADALVVVSELVTNAVVHAGTDVEVGLRMEETGALVVEATDQHPSRAPRSTDPEMPHDPAEYGRGLRLVAALAEAWGITYRPGIKTVWARLSAAGTDSEGQTGTYVGGCAARRPGSPGIRRPGEWPDGTACADGAEDVNGEDAGAGETRNTVRVGEAGPCGHVDEDDQCGHVAHDGRDGAGASPGPDAEGLERPEDPASASGRGAADVGSVADVDADDFGRSEETGRRKDAPGRAVDAGAGQGVGPGAGAGQGAGQGVGAGAGAGQGAGPYVGGGRSFGPDADAGRGRGECSGRSGPAGWRDPWDGEVGTARRGVRDREWLGRGALSFLAEASDLLAGQLDEDLVASLTGQLIVPRLADWCGVWLEDESLGRGAWSDDTGAAVGARLARVWHAGEGHLDELRAALEKDPPRPRDPWRSGPVGHPWPGGALGPDGTHGTALAYRLVAGGRPLGTLVIGRAGSPGAPGSPGFPDEITGLVEDLSRRVALAIGAARQYARQATISAVLQRGLLPGAVAEIPGVRSALVYEPRDKGGPSGDFYDLFPAGDGRWCFAVGDVQGKGPEAAVVIGLARPWLRLLAREQYGVPDVLDRLNQLLLDDATEAADAAARALVAAGGPPVAPGDGPQTRFLSLLYGELVPFDGGVRCTLASAGHPLPLLLGPDGTVSAVACPQTLLGVVEDATYTSETFELRSGDTLLCVTDGITERRSGSRQFDDGDGLATALAGCTGLDAELVAERIRRLVHEFGPRPPEDDLALLVLQAQ